MAGDERIVTRAGRTGLLATEGVIDSPGERRFRGATIVTINFARRRDKVSRSQAAWLKKRWNLHQCPLPMLPLEKITSVI